MQPLDPPSFIYPDYEEIVAAHENALQRPVDQPLVGVALDKLKGREADIIAGDRINGRATPA